MNGQRVKHGDRVSFQTAPDKRNPAKFCAVAVQVGGATVEFEPRVDRARQTMRQNREADRGMKPMHKLRGDILATAAMLVVIAIMRWSMP